MYLCPARHPCCNEMELRHCVTCKKIRYLLRRLQNGSKVYTYIVKTTEIGVHRHAEKRKRKRKKEEKDGE